MRTLPPGTPGEMPDEAFPKPAGIPPSAARNCQPTACAKAAQVTGHATSMPMPGSRR